MIFRISVQDGTGAGSKSRPDPNVAHCACGQFIAQPRALRGETLCMRCKADQERAA